MVYKSIFVCNAAHEAGQSETIVARLMGFWANLAIASGFFAEKRRIFPSARIEIGEWMELERANAELNDSVMEYRTQG